MGLIANGKDRVRAFVLLVLLVGVGLVAKGALETWMVMNQLTSGISNMRQLQLATDQMARDGIEQKNPKFGWPGDLGGGFDEWNAALIEGQYLDAVILNQMLLFAPGKYRQDDRVHGAADSGVLVYAVKNMSPSDTVFLSSFNFTNTPSGGLPLDPSAKPYGSRGFSVMQKSGVGKILVKKHVGQTNIVGSFVDVCR